jgi:hypothetical protein
MADYQESDETEKNDDALWALILGALVGLAISAIFLSLSKPKCPVCNKPIKRGIDRCPHCNSYLRW